jgi:hypothetical protein
LLRLEAPCVLGQRAESITESDKADCEAEQGWAAKAIGAVWPKEEFTATVERRDSLRVGMSDIR